LLKGPSKMKISIVVTNTGNRDGMQSIELFTHQHYASITPSMQRLRAFKKISLKAGESKTVSFELDKHDLAFVNAQLKTVTESGDFDIMIGDKKATFAFQQ
jgi:beta-glucosidase